MKLFLITVHRRWTSLLSVWASRLQPDRCPPLQIAIFNLQPAESFSS